MNQKEGEVKLMSRMNDCTAQLLDYSEIGDWVRSMGGRNAVANLIGKDPSTIHRWIKGDEKTPKLMSQFIKISNENAEIKQKLAKYKRKFGEID